LHVSHHVYFCMYLLVIFVFISPSTYQIYTLSLHDALPISLGACRAYAPRYPKQLQPVRISSAEPSSIPRPGWSRRPSPRTDTASDRKSTRLNSSHVSISYAVFCLKKKTINEL